MTSVRIPETKIKVAEPTVTVEVTPKPTGTVIKISFVPGSRFTASGVTVDILESMMTSRLSSPPGVREPSPISHWSSDWWTIQ